MADTSLPDNTPQVPVIFGTAGHIDHGKSALVKALTGTDPDRFQEEKERGITIDIGFAFLSANVAIIDVPGHERFIKNMVAGAATVDYAVLVIAADDGIMPQTREHMEILELLGCTNGIVALTKADKVDEEWLELITDEVKQYLQETAFRDAPVFVCDSLSGRGIASIKGALFELARQKQMTSPSAGFFMPIDRAFTMKGHGVVVTGSILSGTIQTDSALELLPQQKTVRVRRIQSHGREVPVASAGQRTALNIADLSLSDVHRGMVLATPGSIQPGMLLDVHLLNLSSHQKPLMHRQRVRFHIGTAEVMARLHMLDGNQITPGEWGFAQILLEAPVATRRTSRFVIRQYSPALTIGGGEVLDPSPAKHRRNRPEVIAGLQRLSDGTLSNLLTEAVHQAHRISIGKLAEKLDADLEDLKRELALPIEAGEVIPLGTEDILASGKDYRAWIAKATTVLNDFHTTHPLRSGIKHQELINKCSTGDAKLSEELLHVALDGNVLRAAGDEFLALPSFEINLSKKDQKLADTIEKMLLDSGCRTPSAQELGHTLKIKHIDTLLEYLVCQNRAVCIQGKFFFHSSTISRAREHLQNLFSENKSITIGQIKDSLNSTRKWIIPLAGYFDSIDWTKRVDEQRLPGKKLYEP